MVELVDSLYSRAGLGTFLDRHGMRMSRALGQHFFIHRSMLRAMLRKFDIPEGSRVIEIGPGMGHLTALILEKEAHVVALEKDKRFAAMLKEVISQVPEWWPRTDIRVLDAMEADFAALQQETQASICIGNLPYNVSVPLLFRIAYSGAPFSKLGFLVQREVGERMKAVCGEKPYGRLSVVLQYLYTIKIVGEAPPHAFFPPPKVQSLFVRMEANPESELEFAERFLERVVRVGFLHRRKKLRGHMKGAIVERRVFDDAFMERAAQEFDLEDRAEHWDHETWVRFARFVKDTPPSG